MTWKVVFALRVEQDVTDAAAWYEGRQQNLGHAFIDEVSARGDLGARPCFAQEVTERTEFLFQAPGALNHRDTEAQRRTTRPWLYADGALRRGSEPRFMFVSLCVSVPLW